MYALYSMEDDNTVSYEVSGKADLVADFFFLLDCIRWLQQDATDDVSVLQQTVRSKEELLLLLVLREHR